MAIRVRAGRALRDAHRVTRARSALSSGFAYDNANHPLLHARVRPARSRARPPRLHGAQHLREELAMHRHQGRLRRGRLRRPHGGDRRTRRARRARAQGGQRAASSFCRRSTAARFHRRRPARRRWHAAPGSAGDGRVPRFAVRLLHARLRHVDVGAVREPAGGRPACRRATKSTPRLVRQPAAAARATGRSSTRAEDVRLPAFRDAVRPRRAMKTALTANSGVAAPSNTRAADSRGACVRLAGVLRPRRRSPRSR